MSSITKAIDSGLIKSCHDLSEGGLGVAAAEMAFTGDYGIELFLRKVPRSKDVMRNDHVLFSESNSRFLVEGSEKQRDSFEALMKNVDYAVVGKTRRDSRFLVRGLDGKVIVDTGIDELRQAWTSTLEG